MAAKTAVILLLSEVFGLFISSYEFNTLKRWFFLRLLLSFLIHSEIVAAHCYNFSLRPNSTINQSL